MHFLQAVRKVLNSILKVVIVVLFAAMVIIGTYQIVTRYFFNKPSTVSEELLTYSFAWMALFATAYVFGKRDHMRMAFLADKVTGKARLALEVIIEFLVLVFAAIVMVYGGFSIVKLTMSQVTASLGVSMGYIYSVLPISGIFIVLYNLINIIEMLLSGTADISSLLNTDQGAADNGQEAAES